MFHIFRWRHRHRNDNNETPSDVSTDQENKKSHLRHRHHHHFHMYHGKQPFERLFHPKKHPSSAGHHKQKVISYTLFISYTKVSDRTTCLIERIDIS